MNSFELRVESIYFTKMEKKSRKTQRVNFISPEIPSKSMRKLVGSKERLGRMDRSPFNAWGKPKAIPKRNQTWSQAKIRFPLLKPMGDADGDGVKNIFDCRPFNKSRQGLFHKDQGVLDDVAVGFGDIDKLKTIRDVQKLEEDVLKKEGEE